MIVIDCSALVHYLTSQAAQGQRIAARIAHERVLAVPHLLDAELASALLGMARGSKLSRTQVDQAMADFRSMPVRRHELNPLWERVQQLSAGLSVYDAHYVALAEGLGAPLVTSDARIAKSGAARCRVETF
ncbi:type II toxin-antitoxin system VapC family toxin [Streptomyces sp. A7024]|uniref:Ribonuclease VapC n=1 Tax=Streptomyces coryli TaxID=1128680 RepID=A0A6G4UDQ8_9ACTN|nr:type II toxin-antitoxin system VapC family toxin [Streptomyces coryli]